MSLCDVVDGSRAAAPSIAFDRSRGGLRRFLVGRPGLDPGTLGSLLDRPCASFDVHLSWLEGLSSPPSSTEVLSNLGLRLQVWLQNAGFGVVGVMQFANSNGEKFELRIEN